MSKSREELEKKLAALEKTAIEADLKAAARQRSEGKLTARERIDKLLDPGSFLEEFMLAETQCTDFGMAEKRLPSDGVVTGFGKIDARPVYVFSQDRAVLAGTVGSAHAEKIAYVIQTARKLGVPLIGLNDSAGARIQEGLSVTTAIGKIFFENSIASGCIPQISAVTDLVARNDEECLAMIRRLLGFLPSNFEAPPARKENTDDLNRSLDSLEKIVPEDMRKAYNILQVIKAIVDDGDFLELKAKFARNLVIGFGRLDGYPVGFVANQPMFLAGSLDVDAADKAARFIRFCDAFNIPILTLMDVPGFFPGKQQEEKGIIRHGAKMLYAYAEATVPKITIVLRKGYGGAKQALCTREMGADQLLVWPGVELAVMGGGGAVNILYKREIEQSADPAKTRAEKIAEYQERFNGPFEALSKQFAHAALRPRETRWRLIRSLDILRDKKEDRPKKKHGLMPV